MNSPFKVLIYFLTMGVFVKLETKIGKMLQNFLSVFKLTLQRTLHLLDDVSLAIFQTTRELTLDRT